MGEVGTEGHPAPFPGFGDHPFRAPDPVGLPDAAPGYAPDASSADPPGSSSGSGVSRSAFERKEAPSASSGVSVADVVIGPALAASEHKKEDSAGVSLVTIWHTLGRLRNGLQKLEGTADSPTEKAAIAELRQRATFRTPEICVVGDQGTGKSSVLELVCKIAIFPRGEGMTTRCPVILHLRYRTGPTEFRFHAPHLADRAITAANEVISTILAETTTLCPTPGTISNQPIELTLYSDSVTDMDLIDLPGRVRDDRELGRRIDEMIRRYIREEHRIILAIHPAATDIAASTTLKMASEVDPLGLRTMCVLTKTDLAPDRRQIDALKQRVESKRRSTKFYFPCSLGYVPVVCRAANDQELTTADVQVKEANFFRTNEHWAGFKKPHRCGTAYLVERLRDTILKRIRLLLPEWERQTEELVKFMKQSLEEHKAVSRIEQIKSEVNNAIRKFCVDLETELTGNIESKNPSSDRLSTKAHVEEVFMVKVNEILAKPSSTTDFNYKQILSDIMYAGATVLSIFNEKAFRRAIYRTFDDLSKPVSSCVHVAFKYVEDAVKRCKIQSSFSHLNDRIEAEALKFMRTKLQTCQAFVHELVEMQRYVNMLHPDFAISRRNQRIDEALGGPPPRSGWSIVTGLCELTHRPDHSAMWFRGKWGDHHCRHCGRTCCNNHSLSRMPFPGVEGLHRVCDDCIELMESQALLQKATEKETAPEIPDAIEARAMRCKGVIKCTQELCVDYYDIVSRELADMIEKAIYCMIIEPTHQEMQMQLEEALTFSRSEELLRSLVQLSPTEEKLRNEKMVKLKEYGALLEDVRSMKQTVDRALNRERPVKEEAKDAAGFEPIDPEED